MSPEPSAPLNAFTVDVEDWYHGLTRTMHAPERWPSLPPRVDDTIPRLLDLLAELRTRATFFILGHLAEKHPRLVRRIADAGHELGSHGMMHRRVDALTPGEFRQELRRSREAIAQVASVAVQGFRAPQFSISRLNDWAFQVLSEEGYCFDSSIFPMRSLLYGDSSARRTPYRPLAGVGLVEYPVAVLRFAGVTLPVAGGFYNRMLPYAVIRRGVALLNRRGASAVLYVHPWELDLFQPRIPVSPRERLTHFGGRASLAPKLRRLFSEFSFAPLGEVHRQWLSSN